MKKDYDEDLTAAWRDRLPKNLKRAFGYVYQEDGLIDGCRYMIACADDYEDIIDHIPGAEFPVRSFLEAKSYLRDLYQPIKRK